ncbi:MAG: hypothetical protein ACOX8N_07825 [Christensenellales bacterium]|jgi:hypothetical protein
MKKLLIMMIAALLIGMLAACAPVPQDVEDYARMLPGWAIIVGAVVIFLIGFGIIWKLVPGFVKVLAVLALAAILAGSAYGLWNGPWAERANQLNQRAEEIRDELLSTPTVSPD